MNSDSKRAGGILSIDCYSYIPGKKRDKTLIPTIIPAAARRLPPPNPSPPSYSCNRATAIASVLATVHRRHRRHRYLPLSPDLTFGRYSCTSNRRASARAGPERSNKVQFSSVPLDERHCARQLPASSDRPSGATQPSNPESKFAADPADLRRTHPHTRRTCNSRISL